MNFNVEMSDQAPSELHAERAAKASQIPIQAAKVKAKIRADRYAKSAGHARVVDRSTQAASKTGAREAPLQGDHQQAAEAR